MELMYIKLHVISYIIMIEHFYTTLPPRFPFSSSIGNEVTYSMMKYV